MQGDEVFLDKLARILEMLPPSALPDSYHNLPPFLSTHPCVLTQPLHLTLSSGRKQIPVVSKSDSLALT